jgi:TetR/AcrR family transcriptional repressor of nem operon
VGYSQAEKARSRERILNAAARQIREAGLESVSIAELMKSAELTHGGFYGHFPSRAALQQAAIERAMDNGTGSFLKATPDAAAAPNPVKAIVNSYLSPAHRDNPGAGCAFAGLAGEVGRSDDPAAREMMAARLEQMFGAMAAAMGGGHRAEAAALAAWSTMVGAITLARLVDGPRSDTVLKAARQSILDLAASLEAPAAT